MKETPNPGLASKTHTKTNENTASRGFPGCPVIASPNSGDASSIPGQGSKVPQATGHLSQTPQARAWQQRAQGLQLRPNTAKLIKKRKKEKEIQFSKFTQASSICMFSKVPHVISSHPSWLRTHRCGCDGYKEA